MTEIYLHIVARISSLNKMKNPGMTHKSVAASLTEFLRHYPAKGDKGSFSNGLTRDELEDKLMQVRGNIIGHARNNM